MSRKQDEDVPADAAPKEKGEESSISRRGGGGKLELELRFVGV